MSIIRTESLTKFYGARCAVHELDIHIQDREIVGFLGLNGAGKTTALKMLAGVLSPSYGKIEIDGHDMLGTSADAVRWQIGFLPERPPVYEDMSVQDYLRFAAALRGYDSSKLPARVDEVIELIGASPYKHDPITNLSHGYKQRLGIAQAIVHDPRLVILDEPTNGLDPVQIVQMRTLIRSLKENHTVLISSHNLPEISQTCDRLVVIKEGRLVATGSEPELAQELGGGARLRVELCGNATTLANAMKQLKEDGLIHRWEETDHGEAYSGILYAADTRTEDIAKALVGAGLGLRRLQPEAHELENLFFEVTKATA